eukprot:111834-Rhodomonas_salina.1
MSVLTPAYCATRKWSPSLMAGGVSWSTSALWRSSPPPAYAPAMRCPGLRLRIGLPVCDRVSGTDMVCGS